MSKVEEDLIKWRAGKGAADSAVRMVAKSRVVGVEQKTEARVDGNVVSEIWRQNECLEEPRRMRKVPLGGTDVWHGLDHLVIWRESCYQFQRLITYLIVSLQRVER